MPEEVPTAEEASAAARALDELAAAYEDLAEFFDRNPGEAVEWAQTDIENIGDWEYRVIDLPAATGPELELELNALGDERWEVFWMQTTPDGLRFYLKRSSLSYLNRLPLSALVRMLSGAAQ